MTCFNAVHGTDSAALGARLVTSLSLLKQSGEVKKREQRHREISGGRMPATQTVPHL